MSSLAAVILLFSLATSRLHICRAEKPDKGDRGASTTDSATSTGGGRDLMREATGWERPTYGTQTYYPPAGSGKGWSQRTTGVGQQQGYQQYPTYAMNGAYDSYSSRDRGSYVGGNQGGYGGINQGGYGGSYGGNGKGWSSAGSGWAGNFGQMSRPSSSWSGGYGGNYKGSANRNQGWYGGQNMYGDGWYGGNQVRPSSGGYNWPSSGYRGDKGYGSSSINWGYGNNQGYGGGYGSQGMNKGGLGNQIYGSGYGGAYGGGQKGWGNNGYGGSYQNQGGWGGGNTWGSGNAWGSYGYGSQGNYKGGSSPRINSVNSKGWDTRGGYGNNQSNKGWW